MIVITSGLVSQGIVVSGSRDTDHGHGPQNGCTPTGPSPPLSRRKGTTDSSFRLKNPMRNGTNPMTPAGWPQQTRGLWRPVAACVITRRNGTNMTARRCTAGLNNSMLGVALCGFWNRKPGGSPHMSQRLYLLCGVYSFYF